TDLAHRDLALGELAEAFWRVQGWRRLGYATESQYARERLGMSLSAVKAKRTLARNARSLPGVRQAIDDRIVCYERRRLGASVASPETICAWVDRARQRTVKHLREEVDAAEMLGRIGVDPKMSPPSDEAIGALAELERWVITQPAPQSDARQMSAKLEGAF